MEEPVFAIIRVEFSEGRIVRQSAAMSAQGALVQIRRRQCSVQPPREHNDASTDKCGREPGQTGWQRDSYTARMQETRAANARRVAR